MSHKQSITKARSEITNIQEKRNERQLAGMPALSETEQETLAKSKISSKVGFSNIEPTILDGSQGEKFLADTLSNKGISELNRNKQSFTSAVPQYDLSTNSAYRQQMALRKVRANKL